VVIYGFSNNNLNRQYPEASPNDVGPHFLLTLEKRFYFLKKFKLQPFFSIGVSQHFSYAREAIKYSYGQTKIEKTNAWTGLSGWHYRFGLRFRHNRMGVSLWGSIVYFHKSLSWTTTHKFKYVTSDRVVAFYPEFSLSYSF
jgi:hypothetical protein